MTDAAKTIFRGLFSAFTAGVLVVTFYFPLIGLGYAMDSSADFQSRATGVLLFLPSVAILILLFGMLPRVRGGRLLLLGMGGSLLLLPPIVACAYLGLPAGFGSLAGLVYLALWWFLARAKLSPQIRPATR